MRIGALVRSYGLTDYLTPVLEQYKWLDKVLVMNYRFGGVKAIKDDTPLLTVPFKNAICKTGENLNQEEVLNLGLEEFKDFDWVFISDNDELIQRKDQERLIKETEGFQAGKCRVLDYKDHKNTLPIRSHCQRNDERRFVN